MPAFLWIKFLLYKMCLNIKSLIPNCTVQVSSTVTISSSQDAYGTLILALIKTSMKTLCLIFLKYRFFGINFRGKVTRLVHLSCNKIQNIYLSFTKFLPLNSLHHSKFLDDTGQFLLKYISNSVSLLLTFIADSSATAGNINGFNTWQHMHNRTDFRNLTSICYGQMWENAEGEKALRCKKKNRIQE